MLFLVSECGCHTQSWSQNTVNNQGFEAITKGKKECCVMNDLHKMIKCKHARQLWKCLDTLMHSYCTEE